MEKLTVEQQQQIKKMSNDRLRVKLTAAGYDEETVVAMEREVMMTTYAEVVATGGPKPAVVGYDPAIERERLVFEREKWQADREKWQAEREDRLRREQKEEEEKQRREVKEGEERQRREQKEAEDRLLAEEERKYEENARARREILEQQQMDLRVREIERQMAKDKAEEDRRNSPVVLGKMFGDAMRASAIKMGSDLVEIVAFFKNCEQLFAVYSVPKSLQAMLIRPFLNDRAKTYLTKLDTTVSGDYERLKDAMLREFKLSPNVYLERFNTCTKTSDDTYVSFSSKLTGLLEYYLASRKVTSFDKLCELLVCDRIKSVLTEGCLKHVLSIESSTDTGWMGKADLTNALDRFTACHSYQDKPRAYAVGQSPMSMPRPSFVPSPKPRLGYNNGNSVGRGINKPQSINSASRTGSWNSSGASNTVRKCFECGSTQHLRNACPELVRTQRSSAGVKRVCVENTVNSSRQFVLSPESVDSCVPVCFVDSTCDAKGVRETPSRPAVPVGGQVAAAAGGVSRVIGCDVIGDPGDSIFEPTTSSSKCFPGLPVSTVDSTLKYIDVSLSVDNGKTDEHLRLSALLDSGAEICCVKNELVQQFEPIVTGTVQLRPFCGNPVTADIAHFVVTCDERSIPIWCALVPGLHDDLILTANAVDRLFAVDAKLSRVYTRSMAHRSDDQSVDESDDENNNGVVSVAVDDGMTENDCVMNDDVDVNDVDDANDDVDDVNVSEGVNEEISDTDTHGNDMGSVSRNELIKEQMEDRSLVGAWKLAKREKGGFLIKDNLLYHRATVLGQSFLQLVVPNTRRQHVLKMGHDTFGGHQSVKRTKTRILYTFYWPTVTEDCRQYVKTCAACQMKAKVTYRDRVPIKPIPRAGRVFDHWFIDCGGPFVTSEGQKVKYNYAFIAVDSFSRFPYCQPLKSLTAKAVCDALLSLWSFTGCSSHVSSDLGTNFTSQLTREFEKRMGCTPRFNSPYHPSSTGLAERGVGNIKQIVAKLAMDRPKQWHTYLPMAMWCLREAVNETTGVPPWTLVMGFLPRGPLTILRESWCEEREFPVNLGKSATEYLRELHDRLEIAQTYATSHTEREQNRYVSHYNLRSKDKHFDVGEQVLILSPDSTSSRMFSKWTGPATVVEVRSPYSYIVELDGVRKHFHANKLRKFHVRIDSVKSTSLIDDLESKSVNTCAIVYHSDKQFGDLSVVPSTVSQPGFIELPSQKIDKATIAHLTPEQQTELLEVLDTFPECFSDVPGFTDVVEHTIHVSDDFKPKRLNAYRVPERLKAEVDRQIQEMLSNGIIRPSKSPMASPMVCVLKGKNGCDGVRLAVDYRYVNRFTRNDAFPLPDMSSVFQRIGKSRFITIADCKAGYWQLGVKEEDKWLTAFVCDAGLFEFNRVPFGMKCSGASFVRAITKILRPVNDCADSFVDDVAVHSDQWKEHLAHISRFLQTVKCAGITLNLKKCRWAQGQVRFCGEILGSGKRFADGEKVKVVHEMQKPQTKTELRRMLGFFSYFREHIPNFSEIAKPLTDLTAKRVAAKIPWGSLQQQAFEKLKCLLCRATMEPLCIVDFDKPFDLYVDSSSYAVSSVLAQTSSEGVEMPVAFASMKLTETQRNWSTIEREAYAALVALRKYRNWIFGSRVTVHSDHNPLLYITESAPKSAKLMRWSLSLAEFEVTFKYRAGKSNVAADFLSRLKLDD